LQEVAAERDVLQERVEQQLLRISALQSRVDEQRQKDDRLLKEANMELQMKICDQDQEITMLHEKIENKELEVCNELVLCCVFNYELIKCRP
jgi:hypothetical protein